MDFAHGILEVGAVLAPPVIKKVKIILKMIRRLLLMHLDFCPMINAVSGVDYCIMVTEPTPFGLNDLKLAVEVVQELKIPFGVIINRAGTGYSDMENYLSKEGIPLLMKIPFDSAMRHVIQRNC